MNGYAVYKVRLSLIHIFFDQPNADCQGAVDPPDVMFVQPADVVPQTTLVNGAKLLQKDERRTVSYTHLYSARACYTA